MNGRMEKDLIFDKKLIDTLVDYPAVIADFCEDMKDNGKTMETVRKYVNYIIHFYNYFTKGKYDEKFYTKVTPVDIKRYMNSLKTRVDEFGNIVPVGDEIRAVRWSAINLFFSFLKENEYIISNPVEKTKRPKVTTEHTVTYLTEEEIKAVFENIKKTANPEFVNRDLCLYSLAVKMGLRISAIVNINIEDINFNENYISVVEKENKKRKMPFGENMRALLKAWIKDRRRLYPDIETDALFVSRFRRRMSVDMARTLVKKYTKNVTNKKITPHKLRASCAVAVYDQTKDIMVTKELLGHNSIDTTTRYVRASEDGKKEAINYIDKLF